MKRLAIAFGALVFLIVASPFASATITFDLATTHTYQQTTNAPCVIGNPSCNNPADFSFFSQTSTPGGNNGSTYDLYSPIYLVHSTAGVSGINEIPTSFLVGIDDNFAGGAGFENLVYLDVYIWTGAGAPTPFPGVGGVGPLSAAGWTLSAINSYQGPTEAINVDNGNGYADAILSGYSFSAGTYVRFDVKINNDSDGFEQVFIIPAGQPILPVPEPTTIVLLGAGLVGLAFIARRKRE